MLCVPHPCIDSHNLVSQFSTVTRRVIVQVQAMMAAPIAAASFNLADLQKQVSHFLSTFSYQGMFNRPEP